MVKKHKIVLTEKELINLVNETAQEVREQLFSPLIAPMVITEPHAETIRQELGMYESSGCDKDCWHTVLDVVSIVLTIFPPTTAIGVGLGVASGVWHIAEGDESMGIAMIVLELLPMGRLFNRGSKLLKSSLKEMGPEGVEQLTKKIAKVGFGPDDFRRLSTAEQNAVVAIGRNKTLQREIINAMKDPQVVKFTKEVMGMSDDAIKKFAKEAVISTVELKALKTMLTYGANDPRKTKLLFKLFEEMAWLGGMLTAGAATYIGVEAYTNPKFRKMLNNIMRKWTGQEIKQAHEDTAETAGKSFSYFEKELTEEMPEAFDILFTMVLDENCTDMDEDEVSRLKRQLEKDSEQLKKGIITDTMNDFVNSTIASLDVGDQCFKDWLLRCEQAGLKYQRYFGCTSETGECRVEDMVVPEGFLYEPGGAQWDNNDFPLHQGKGDDGSSIKRVTAIQRWLNDSGYWGDKDEFKGCKPKLETDGHWGSNLQSCWEEMRAPGAGTKTIGEKYYNKHVRVPYERYETMADFNKAQKEYEEFNK